MHQFNDNELTMAETVHGSRSKLKNKCKRVISLTQELCNDKKYKILENRILKLESTLEKIKHYLDDERLKKIVSLQTLSNTEKSERIIKIIDIQKRDSEIVQQQVLEPIKKRGKYPRDYDVKLKIQRLMNFEKKLSEYALQLEKIENLNQNFSSTTPSISSEKTVTFDSNKITKCLNYCFGYRIKNASS